MFIGKERLHKKPYSLANKKGFISIYALALLSVVIAFIAMVAQQITSIAMSRKSAMDTKAELYILHYIHKMTLASKDESEVTESVKTSTQENLMFHDYTITLIKNQDVFHIKIHGPIKTVKMNVIVDEIDKYIKNVAYIS